MKHTIFLTISVILTFMLVQTGCAWIDEVGEEKSKAEFRLTPSSSDNTEDMFSCARSQFPVCPEHFETNAPKDSLTLIGMYRSTTEKLSENSVSIRFVGVNADTLEDCPEPSTLVGSDIEISDHSCVRASILLSACDDPLQFIITGTLHLDSFSTERGGRMSGSIAGTLEYAEYIETSSQTYERRVSLGTVEGEYSFVNKAGAVWSHGRVPTQ